MLTHFTTLLRLTLIASLFILLACLKFSTVPPARAGVGEWTALGPEFATAKAVAVDPQNPETVYAGTPATGLYKSTDGGQNWTHSSNGLPAGGDIRQIAVDPADSNIVYVGVTTSEFSKGNIYKSTDGGASWRQSGGLDVQNIVGLVINPQNTSILYVAVTGPSTVYKSTDGGANWSNTNLNNIISMWSLAIDPKNPETVYAGTEKGVYKTTNGGGDWAATKNSDLSSSRVVEWLAVDPQNTSTVYAAVPTRLFKSVNGGASWQPAETGLTGSIKHGVIDPQSPTTLYVSCLVVGPQNEPDLIYKSTDGGASWSSVQTDLHGPLAINPADSTILYIADSSGIYKSSNGGGNWSLSSSGMNNLRVEDLAVEGSHLYLTSRNGLFTSSDGGGSWSADAAGLPTTDLGTLAIDRSTTPPALYVGASASDGVYKSVDRGATWTAANNGLPEGAVRDIAVAPASPTTLYASTLNGLFKSSNGGDSWSKLGAADAYNIFVLAVDPIDAETVYAGTFSSGAYKTTDGGSSWTEINTGLTDGRLRVLLADPAASGVIYAGTLTSVFKSVDGGATWTAADTGLTDSEVNTLVFDPASSTTLYLGTEAGIFKSGNGGASWTELPDAGLSSKDITAIAPQAGSSPLRLYVGTNGGGVFEGQFLDTDAPVVDLNGPATGVNYTVALDDFSQTASPLAIVDSSQLTVSTPVTPTLQSATVTLTNRLDGGAEQLDANVGGGLSKSYDSSSGTLTLTGPADAAAYQTALRTVTYQNSSADPDRSARTITFVVSDGTLSSAPATATVFEVRGRVYLPVVIK